MDSNPVFILNGPNLNMLGVRQPEIYGSTSLTEIESVCYSHASSLGLTVSCRQSNHEGDLVTWIQEAHTQASAIILNAGAYAHTSIAIFDALLLVRGIPLVEVHLSNVYSREYFRRRSCITPVVTGLITGFGSHVYQLAIDAVAYILLSKE